MLLIIIQLWASITLALFSLSEIKPYEAPQASKAPIIDGKAIDDCWAKAKWAPIDQRWLGPEIPKTDFQGKYKAIWDKDYLYILAEIVDDTLIDIHPEGLDKYWDDDCLEVFLDEDHSGGDHLASFNAWAYHSALDGKTTDFGTDGKPHYYNEHVRVAHKTKNHTTIWEAAYSIYADTYVDGKENKPVILTKNKEIGFAIAYCDNDHSPERENFFGSIPVAGTDKNQGYKTASVFGRMVLR
jgi:hypothetical protein